MENYIKEFNLKIKDKFNIIKNENEKEGSRCSMNFIS